MNLRGWIAAAGWAGVDIDEFPTLKKWEERMWARPAVQKGANVPEPYKMKELLKDKEGMEKHAAQVSWRCVFLFQWRDVGKLVLRMDTC